MQKVFLDTNIILDFLDDKRPHHNNALKLMALLATYNWQVVISEDMMSTIFYIRKNPKQVLAFYQYVLSHWSVVPYGLELMKEAVKKSLENSLDLEDMLQCLCAKKEGCAIVVTEGQQFVDCGIDVMDYERCLNEIR